MHIGFICHEYPPCNHGGIGSFTKELAEGLVKFGHQVSVIGFYQQNVLELNEPVNEILNGVSVYRYPLIKKFSRSHLDYVYQRWKLYRIVKTINTQERFDVIESPENQGWFPFGIPANISLVTRLHGGEVYLGNEIGRGYSRFVGLLEKNQIKKSSKLISVSDYVGRRTLEVLKIEKKYTTIYNAVKLDVTKQKENLNIFESFLIVFAGSIVKNKGVEELISAMNIILGRFPSAKLMLAGKNNRLKDGEPYEKYLLSLLNNKRYEKSIHFLGPLDREKELFPLLKKAHVCCFPSYIESFSFVPIEAMALGKAVVFTKFSSGPEAIEDGISGLLCDSKDPVDIAEKIIRLFTDDVLRVFIEVEGKKRVEEKFEYTKWLDENNQFFYKLQL